MKTSSIRKFAAAAGLAVVCFADAVGAEPFFAKPSTTAAPLRAIDSAGPWLNTPPLKAEQLRGKVVLVDFWTYSCINCLRTLPYVRAWAQRYKDAGLVVVGVHTPEFDFEKLPANVQKATTQLHIDYPVVMDSDFAVWNAFGNRAWPALYFVDAQGRVRHRQYGEGKYEAAEQLIRQLLTEAGRGNALPPGLSSPAGEGTQAAPAPKPALSEETYLGYAKASGFDARGGAARDRVKAYAGPAPTQLDHWSLAGDWTVAPERVVLAKPNGRIAYRFLARDVHLVLGPAADGKPVRFRVSIDGKPPLDDRGADVDAQGMGRVDVHKLYQLVRRKSNERDALFEIEFLDPGVQAYAFTFG
jgi:thiol-disulfide isomerase/thioredoxin